MDTQDIEITLKRINSDLDRIFKSRGWLHILNSSQEPMNLENILGSALFHTTDLKLRVARIINQKPEESSNANT